MSSRSRLEKARRWLAELRRRPFAIKARELIQLAELIGRKPDNARGKEPTYDFPGDYPWSRVLTIPRHGKRDLKLKTAKNILNHLEGDIDNLEEMELTKENSNGASKNGRH